MSYRSCKRHLSLILCAVMLLCATGVSYALPGSSSDPAATLSYVNDMFLPRVMAYTQDAVDEHFSAYTNALDELLDELEALSQINGSPEAFAENAMRSAAKLVNLYANGTKAINIQAGDTLIGGSGCSFRVLTGSVESKGNVINMTGGVVLQSGAIIPEKSILYTDDGASLVARADTTVLINGFFRYIPAPSVKNDDIALALMAMGLAKGTGNGFELSRPTARDEGFVMLLRLLGESEAAELCTTPTPFKDLVDWSKNYAAYCYEMGYTSGTSSTEFSPTLSMSADQYCSVVLTALGYIKEVDFKWNEAVDFAAALGIFTVEDGVRMRDMFNRDELYFVSFKALFATLNNTQTTLLQKLIGAGVVDAQAALDALSGLDR